VGYGVVVGGGKQQTPFLPCGIQTGAEKTKIGNDQETTEYRMFRQREKIPKGIS
jgi:hypothetical protein